MSTPPPITPPPAYAADAGRPIPTYLAWSIIATVLSLCFCCIIGTIPGIVAIVFSTKVKSALDRGDLAEARDASDKAKLWCWITTGLVIVGILLNIILFATGGMAEYMEFAEGFQAAQG